MTLASKVENSLPKVSYIKASEIWFLGCTIFLFAAMVEFAFVNTIYRRKYDILFNFKMYYTFYTALNGIIIYPVYVFTLGKMFH